MDTDELFHTQRAQSATTSIQSNFSDRQRNLFAQLEKAEVTNQKRIIPPPETPMDLEQKPNETISINNKRKRSETKCLRGQESIFKRPEEPLARCLPLRTIPDHHRNPHKWTKYSLDDVRTEDTSDRGNTIAALSFLRELEERKLSGELEQNREQIKIKPRFNTTAIIRKRNQAEQNDEDDDDDKASFKGSKIIMPEYVVGQKKKPVRKVTTGKQKEKIKEIKLNHLLDEFEEETE